MLGLGPSPNFDPKNCKAQLRLILTYFEAQILARFHSIFKFKIGKKKEKQVGMQSTHLHQQTSSR